MICHLQLRDEETKQGGGTEGGKERGKEKEQVMDRTCTLEGA